MTLPTGFTIRLADDVLRAGDGSLLIGGSPLLAMRLTPQAQDLIDRDVLVVRDTATGLLGERLLDTNLALPVLDPLPVASVDDLTVVVPVHDRSEALERTLSALAGLRVLVVDDASADAAEIERVVRRHRATLLRSEINLGPGGARNAGLAGVHTPYVAFVDSDVIVSADTLVGLTAHFADPSVGVVAPHVRSRAATTPPRWFERYDEATPALGLGERAGVVRPGAAVAWLPSACLVVRVDTLGSGFDGRMRVGEDVDLVWRLIAAGHRVRYDPSFSAYHEVRPTLRAWMGRKFVYGTGGAALAERHPDNLVTARLAPAMGAAALALMLRRPWSIPAALVGSAHGARTLVRVLPDCPEQTSLAVRLAVRGLGWSLRQESALVLRHWWPGAAAAALVSKRARRVVVSAMIIDVIGTRIDGPALDPVTTFAGRRLDDLAYGAGLWWGALRHRSAACLKVRWNVPSSVPPQPRRRSPSGS